MVAEGWRHHGRTGRSAAGERQRGIEILRIARQWEEARQNTNEGEGDNLGAASLTHDDGAVFSVGTLPLSRMRGLLGSNVFNFMG